jgi:hypothetical protein
MKKILSVFGLMSIFSLVVLVSFSGCYTQVGATRDTDEDNEYVAESPNDDSSFVEESNTTEYTDNGYCDDTYRPRVGFNYYYPSTYWPSTAFTVAYSDPWFYDYNWWAYDHLYYTSPYSWYYSSWYPSYYYPPYYYGNYYNNGGSYVYGSRRNDGKMLGNDNARRLRDNTYEVGGAVRTNFDLPAAGSLKRTPSNVSGANRNTTNVRTMTRRDAANSVNTRRENRATERSFDQPTRAPRQGKSDDRKRDTRTQQRPVETYKPPSPSNNPVPRETRTPTPSYTPPPAPRNNTPPPSNDGGRRNDGGGGSRSSSGGSGSRDRRP